MKVADLQQILQAADPAAVLVSSRVLDRVIQQVCNLPNLLWNVPHRKCYVVDRHVLFRHVEQDELDLPPDQLLPPRVILLARPPVDQLGALERESLLLKYWQRLFHASVHLHLESRVAEGRLTPDDLRERVEQIGQAEFEEIRSVLVQDHYLVPGADERGVYIEFAAVYLELRFFAANLLPVYFPGLRDFAQTNELLARDVDAAALFARTRLAGAPDPVVRTDTSSDEAHTYYWTLVRGAERAARDGNTVRAAILRTKAARVAPAALTAGTLAEAEADLTYLVGRLQAAFKLPDADAVEWMKDLPKLLDKADQGDRPVEALVLYDLQQVCLDHERDLYALDLVEWLLSAGKRPIKRPLPSQRVVLPVKHLRSAGQRLTAARISDADREHLAQLLQAALQQSEDRLRARFRPVLTDALQDVGLLPANPPERAAFHKMIEELLDRITAYGFLTFSDLRDAISRNQLKLPDLPDPGEFVRGDPLLRLDRRLANLLDGVYRRSEVYMRWLERLTALNFGTGAGRAFTRFVTIPFGSAFVLQEGLSFLLNPDHEPFPPSFLHYLQIVLIGFIILALMHVAPLRRRFVEIGLRLYRPLRVLCIDFPLRLYRNATLRRLVASWPFQLFYWYLFKPLAAYAVIRLSFPEAFSTWMHVVSTFLAVSFLLNSRLGHALSEALLQGTVLLVDSLRSGLLPNLFHFIVRVFKQAIDMVESVLFTVDEWLRFRAGDSRASLIARTVLGLLWFPVSYLARFVMVVLIEPCINPIKLPVTILAAKFLIPFNVALTVWLKEPLGTVQAGLLANLIASWMLPDAFGFLFWETKGNWSLYRANRQDTLAPVALGPHGETLRGLLHPGFHSGTVSKFFARWRQAEREAVAPGNAQTARSCRLALHEVETALRHFAERELVSVLQQASSWRGQSLRVGPVALACNRIGIDLYPPDSVGQPIQVEFEERAGWLVAGLRASPWLDQLTPEQLRALTTALASLYKLAGVELVREQLRSSLPPGSAYDLTSRGLVLWLDRCQGRSVCYDLRDPTGLLKPQTSEGELAQEGPPLDPNQLVFARFRLTWQQWVETWQKDQDGHGHPGLFKGDVELVLVGRQASFDG